MLNATNLGDLAQTFLLRRNTAATGGALNRLTEELATGRVSDLRGHLGGDFAGLAGIERDFSVNAALARSNDAAARFASAQQSALEVVQTRLSEAGPAFASAGASGEATQMRAAFRAAEDQLGETISALNGEYAGRSLFAGIATDASALVDAETLLSDLGAALSGSATAADALTAADAWFDTPGGPFETAAYNGSGDALAPLAIGTGERVTLDVTAADPALRETLKGVALVALLGRGLLASDQAEQATLLREAGTRLANANDDVIDLQSGIGFAQERIEAAKVRGEVMRTSLEAARGALVEADPYETSIRLREVETRLSTLYAITSRLAGLSLAQVLR